MTITFDDIRFVVGLIIGVPIGIIAGKILADWLINKYL